MTQHKRAAKAKPAKEYKEIAEDKTVIFDEAKTEEGPQPEAAAHQSAAPEKVKIEFPFSDLVRAQIPKAFDVAERVATDWKNEGEFQDLGLPHPLVDVLAGEALKKAKQVEKMLEEKGVFSMAKMGLAIAKAQVEELKKKF